jgi:putative DNA primase/helicase
LFGEGENGKSLLTNAMVYTMGDYATVADESVFTETRNEQHPTHLAALRGARMVLLSEIAEGRHWNESRLKGFVAGDPMSARVMRGDPFEFVPVGKLWIAANHLPTMRNPGVAMRRRLCMAPMLFRPARADRTLPGILKGEAGGVLGWMIEGCRQWQQQGLNPPGAVLAATAEYLDGQDRIGTWLAEQCEACSLDPKESAGVRELYGDYRTWMHGVGEVAKSEMEFSAWLGRRYRKKHTEIGTKFLGIRLRPRPGEIEGFSTQAG